MKENKIRALLREGKSTIATRLISTQSCFVEALGATGNYDYVEFIAEYAPYDLYELQNFCIAAELHNMGTMIKCDFQDRGFVAQKAIASGFQAIMFTDCHNAAEVKEAIRLTMPDTPKDGGCFGYPNNRFIDYQSRLPQMDHAARVRDTVRVFMIEKASAVEDIENICSAEGVDMVQFGPSDYCMSCGKNRSEFREEALEAERLMIATAQKHNVAVRCEIPSVADAKYYMDLGVRHFCLGDQMNQLEKMWAHDGKELRTVIEKQ